MTTEKFTTAPPTCQFHINCHGYCESERERKIGLCSSCMEVHDQHWTGAQGDVMTFGYTNYRGEFSQRRATPIRFEFGSTEHHPEPQWLMYAVDHDKTAIRAFALADMVMGFQAPVAPPESLDIQGRFENWDNNVRVKKPFGSTMNMKTERKNAYAAGFITGFGLQASDKS